MKNLLIIFGSIILLSAATCGGCGGTCSATTTNRTVLSSRFNNNDNPKTVQLKITGMDCAMCTNAVHRRLSQTDGIIKDDISYENGSAIITYDPAKITVEKIIKVIEAIGYKATVVKESSAKKPDKPSKNLIKE
ncbi:MAG: heavy-metal-associated domain-containing protein [Bacteroidota bacterium]|nr:heavy-metal-associated domain-containing protein [Bacteroidota bacterium]